MSKCKLYGLQGFKFELAVQYLLLRQIDPSQVIVYLKVINDLQVRPRITFADACVAILAKNKVGTDELVEFLLNHA